jgi:hypothetical protein
MTRHLLVAEADHIQDLLFRSSQLREVVGGSQLLKRFSNDVPRLLAEALELTLDADVEIITTGGGGFYLDFADANTAQRFGAALAEAYYRTTGSTLSVIARPVEYSGKDEDYPQASEKASEYLHAAKRQGSFVALAQMPYIAFCESCGVGLAEAHEKRSVDEAEREESRYLCPACRAKAAERVDRSLGQFLKPFYARIVSADSLDSKDKMEWPHDADSVGRFDPRNYVAYIVADGNDMGQVFNKCSKSQAKALSRQMNESLQTSLAAPVRTFRQSPAGNTIQQFLPVLPLIMGGDDLFALVPAPWALDIAGHLCRDFQKQMTEFARAQGILADSEAITMTAAVVICKANYPYYLAHKIGDARLRKAKRVVKALARDEGHYLSAVDFEVILGSQVEPASWSQECDYLPTLRPYWVMDDADQPVVLPPRAWGLPLDILGS